MYVSNYVTVTVITQPDNTTACEGGTAIFTCVVDIHNVSIDTRNTNWWRTRIDHNHSMPIKIVLTASGHRTVNSISEHRLTSLLMITNVKLTHKGPYWLKFNKSRNLSDVAYLSVTPNGMYVCSYNICTYDIFISLWLRNFWRLSK